MPKIMIALTTYLVVFCFLPDSFADEKTSGFKDESELGLVITSGNSKSQSFNAKQLNTYGWSKNIFRFDGKYLKSSSSGVESARQWSLSLRYERTLNRVISTYFSQAIVSDIFSGTKQKYNSDVGLKYSIVQAKDFEWIAELGYRYSKENRTDSTTINYNLGRLFSEVTKELNEKVSSKLQVEYLYDFGNSHNYNVNTEASILVTMVSILSLKTGFALQYDNEPNPGILKNTDTVFTTAMVAKF